MALKSAELGRLRTKRLIRAGTSGLAARMLIVALGLAATPVIVRSLGAGQYGVYATVTMMSAMFAFADLGIGNGLVTRLATLEGTNDKDRQRQAVSNALVLLLLAAAGFLVLGVVTALVVPWTMVLGADSVPADDLQTTVIVFTVLFAMSVPSSLGQKVLVGLQRGGAASMWLLATMTTSLGLTALVAAVGADLPVVVGATIGAPVCVGAWQTILLLRSKYRYLKPRLGDVTGPAMLGLLRVGSLFLVLSVAGAVAFQTDLLVVSAVVGAEAAGVLAICLRLFQLVTTTNSALLSQLWPAFAEALERQDVAWVRQALRRSVFGIVLTVAPLMVLLVLAGQALIQSWVGPSMVPPTGLLIAMAFWTLQQCLIFPVAMLMNGAGVVRFQAIAGSSMAVANIVTSVLLVHLLGLAGPVWASLLTHTVINAVPAVVVIRRRILLSDRLPAPVAATGAA